jgi:hypothetical protein
MFKCGAGVIRRVYVDALYLSGVEGQQGFEGFKVVSLDYDVSGIGIAATEFFFLYQQAVFGVGGGFEVLFAGEPMEGGHLGGLTIEVDTCCVPRGGHGLHIPAFYFILKFFPKDFLSIF